MHLQLETLCKGTSVMLHLGEWPIHAQNDSNPWLLVNGARARPLRHNNSLWSSRPDLDGEAQTVGLEEVDGSRTGTLELVETKLLRQNFGRKFHLRNIFWPTNETLKISTQTDFILPARNFFRVSSQAAILRLSDVFEFVQSFVSDLDKSSKKSFV